MHSIYHPLDAVLDIAQLLVRVVPLNHISAVLAPYQCNQFIFLGGCVGGV